MEHNEIKESLMDRIAGLNENLYKLNNDSETLQRQLEECLTRETNIKKSIAECDAKHNISAIVAMNNSLSSKQTALVELKQKIAKLEECITDLDRQIAEQTARLKDEKEVSLQSVQAAVSDVKDSWSEYVSSITYLIDDETFNLSTELFREITATVFENRDSNNGNETDDKYGKAHHVISVWMKEDVLYYLYKPLLDAVLFGLYKSLELTSVNNPLTIAFFRNYGLYSKNPTKENLKNTIDSALERIIGHPDNKQLLRFKWEDKVKGILPQLVDIYCPVYRDLKRIFFTSGPELNWLDSLRNGEDVTNATKDILVELGLWTESVKNGLGSVYSIAAAEFNYEPAVKDIAHNCCGYNTVTGVYNNGVLWPVFNGKADTAYPSISTGLGGGDDPVMHLKMIDFFNSDTSSLNHFISVTYDKNKTSPEVASTVVQSVLASVMAWMGPRKFTLDFIDFEYSGIGAYPAQFLPKNTVNIISSLAEWDDELNLIEKLVEKRSQKMQSIFQYNRLNPDNIELFKIIVIQDYEGLLVHLEEPKYETRESERQKTNVRRFIRFLELGYKYGIIFLVSSQDGVYHSSVPAISLNGVNIFTDSYSIFGIEGLSTGPDYFMKWLADGWESESGKNKHKAGEQHDGADGFLTTEIADDGTDVEFRMDTVSHTHAFVIGKTGSGKSVLLHNIITGLINSYGPDDLELYLLDLKMGGVEFNRYRRLPHLRSLLVDNSDIQIVLEIMRDIDLMMRERGKAFRNAGVSNVKEYNRANPDKKMAQVIVVIDECHAIFSMDGGRGAAREQREITERLVKIAKEGRSQGIHLIFATQTLSGSEIPPDIQKNITDYYLLKCAPSDSESLVRGSSSKTEALPVGKVYYYHADRQALFQGIYNDNEACEELIAEALRRHSGRKSHGQFYFNGAQTFELNKEIAGGLNANAGHTIPGSPGRMINLQQTPVVINLRKDYSENILLTGINNEEQLSRTTLALMGSQILAAKAAGVRLKVNVINCLDPEAEASTLLREMADSGVISLYRPTDSEGLLKQLCENVNQKAVPNDTMLYIFGQERFGELKRDQKFADDTKDATGAGDITDIFQGLSFTTSSSADPTAYDSFKKAIIYLLENGPSAGLHTVIQIDKPDKLLYEDFISAKTVSARFKHIVILRSDPRAAMSLGLGDDINVESLSADPERLRAYYYCDEDGIARLFSPYDIITTRLLTEN